MEAEIFPGYSALIWPMLAVLCSCTILSHGSSEYFFSCLYESAMSSTSESQVTFNKDTVPTVLRALIG